MNINNLSLTINFNDISSMNDFIKDLDQLELIKLKKIFKKSDKESVADKRGGQTKILHVKAKEYQQQNPSASYKDSLRRVGEIIRKDKNENKIVEDIIIEVKEVDLESSTLLIDSYKN